MDEKLQFDYYYGIEAEQFSFYRVPRLLIKDTRFKKLSSDAKLLYGLMLDRMSLSIKNGWLDDNNRAYIHYTMDNVLEDLGCAREKGAKVLAELDSIKGIGLIEKKRQGLGKPDIIYVKNIATVAEKMNVNEEKSASNTDVSTEVRKSNFCKFENRISVSSEIELLEVRKPNSNYNNNNYTDFSQTESIYQSAALESIDEIDITPKYINLIKKNIEYDEVMKNSSKDIKELYDELFGVICEVVCVNNKTVRISGKEYPYELVKAQFLRLDSSHLQYVIECMRTTSSKIANIKAYMITALYNAPNTISHYYQQEVQHDLYGGM